MTLPTFPSDPTIPFPPNWPGVSNDPYGPKKVINPKVELLVIEKNNAIDCEDDARVVVEPVETPLGTAWDGATVEREVFVGELTAHEQDIEHTAASVRETAVTALNAEPPFIYR